MNELLQRLQDFSVQIGPLRLTGVAVLVFVVLFVVAVLMYVTLRRRPGLPGAPAAGPLDQLARGLAKTRDRLGLAIRRALGQEVSDDTIAELEGAMLQADMGVRTTEAILEDVRSHYRAGRAKTPDELIALIRKDLNEKLEAKGTELRTASKPPTVILVVGVNGAGKTTSIAKLTAHLKGEGKKVLLAAGDTFRAAAVEQLSLWAGRLGVDIIKSEMGADPAAVAFDATDAAIARGVDYLIVDTAGRLHTHQNLMAELSKVKRVIQKRIPDAPHETLLVLDATTGQNAIAQARSFMQATDVTGIFLAKLDGTAKGGIVVAIRDELDIPVKFVGLGEKPEDIQRFDPRRFVDALLS
jgi:fused signal recognition particle receptor